MSTIKSNSCACFSALGRDAVSTLGAPVRRVTTLKPLSADLDLRAGRRAREIGVIYFPCRFDR
jgi:hypothetical protein